MDISDIKSLKQEIVKRLMPLDPEKVILFGSYAYGTPTPESDLDICVIEKSFASKMEEKRKIRRLLSDIPLSKDILVEEESHFLSHSDENWINTALYDIRKRGEVLFEKG